MYQNILVPVDGSELAECVLPHLEAMVNRFGIKAIIFLRVIEPLPAATIFSGKMKPKHCRRDMKRLPKITWIN